ncbi:MAG: RNA methyltransferase [Planctomycetota bacterium]
MVARFRSAAAGDLPGVVLVEGRKLVGEALRAGLRPREVACSPRFRDEGLRATLRAKARVFADCSDPVLARMSALTTHQGIAVLFERRQIAEEDLLSENPLIAAAAGVRDPGNLGALIRTAEAAGATGFLSLAGGADPFRDKAVRGAMGSLFRLPVLHGIDVPGLLSFASRHSLQLVAADGSGAVDHREADFTRPTVLVLGGEGAGIPPGLAERADLRVRIDIEAPVESLNVAVAAGVLLFEARRQRG